MDYASIVDYFPETEVLIFEESDLSGAGLPGLQAGRPREPWCSLIYLVLIRIIAPVMFSPLPFSPLMFPPLATAQTFAFPIPLR